MREWGVTLRISGKFPSSKFLRDVIVGYGPSVDAELQVVVPSMCVLT